MSSGRDEPPKPTQKKEQPGIDEADELTSKATPTAPAAASTNTPGEADAAPAVSAAAATGPDSTPTADPAAKAAATKTPEQAEADEAQQEKRTHGIEALSKYNYEELQKKAANEKKPFVFNLSRPDSRYTDDQREALGLDSPDSPDGPGGITPAGPLPKYSQGLWQLEFYSNVESKNRTLTFIVDSDNKINVTGIRQDRAGFTEDMKQVFELYKTGPTAAKAFVVSWPEVKDYKHLRPDRMEACLDAALAAGVDIEWGSNELQKIADLLASKNPSEVAQGNTLMEKEKMVHAKAAQSDPKKQELENNVAHENNIVELEKKSAAVKLAKEGLQKPDLSGADMKAGLQKLESAAKDLGKQIDTANAIVTKTPPNAKMAAGYGAAIAGAKVELESAKKVIEAGSPLVQAANDDNKKLAAEVHKTVDAQATKLEGLAAKAGIEAKPAKERMEIKAQELGKAADNLNEAQDYLKRAASPEEKAEAMVEIRKAADAVNKNLDVVRKEMGKKDVDPAALVAAQAVIAKAEEVNKNAPSAVDIAFAALSPEATKAVKAQYEKAREIGGKKDSSFTPKAFEDLSPQEIAQTIHEANSLFKGTAPVPFEQLPPDLQAAVIYIPVEAAHPEVKQAALNHLQERSVAEASVVAAKDAHQEAEYRVTNDVDKRAGMDSSQMISALAEVQQVHAKIGSPDAVMSTREGMQELSKLEHALQQVDKVSERMAVAEKTETPGPFSLEDNKALLKQAEQQVLEVREKVDGLGKTFSSNAGADDKTKARFSEVALKAGEVAEKVKTAAEKVAEKIQKLEATPGAPTPGGPH